MLYGLSLGFGDVPLDAERNRFVYEQRLKIVPTFPTVIAWLAEPTFTSLGVDPLFALHGEQRIDIHRPLQGPMSVRAQGKVLAVYDKGEGRGAVIVTEQRLFDVADGAPVATLTTSCFGRKEGGCGKSASAPARPHSLPARAADCVVGIATAPNLALLYRLTGDSNPLHVDPAVAAAAGFPRPILHGLCGFGITCRAVLETFADFDPRRIVSHQARFAAPVFPGETLSIDLWRDADVVSFQARVAERGVIAISNGKAVLRD